MANVVAIYDVGEGLSGGLNAETRDGGVYTRMIQVEFDGFNPYIWAALEASNDDASIPDDELSSVPSYGEAHPEDNSSLLLDKQANPVGGDPSTWLITCHYKYPTIDTNAGGSPPSPDDPTNGDGQGDAGGGGSGSGDNPPTPIPNQRRSVGTFTRQKAWAKDRNGLLIANSAGDPFDPPLATEEPLPEFTFTRSQSSFDIGWKVTFEGAVNKFDFELKIYSSVYTCEARTLKVSRITAEETPPTEHAYGYWTITVVLQYDPNGWQPAPLDAGFRELVDGALHDIFDPATGSKVAKPALLDGDGAQLAVGGDPVYIDGTAPASYGPFIIHKERNFKWLALSH